MKSRAHSTAISPATASGLIRVARNSFFLLSMSLAIRLLGVLLVAKIGRDLGEAGLGRYTFVLSFVFVAEVFMDMGISSRAIRTFAREKEAIPRMFLNVLAAKAFLFVVAFASCAGLLVLLRDDRETILAGCAFLAGMGLFSLGTYVRVHFDSVQRMEFQAALEVLRQAIVVFFSLWALQKGRGLIALGVIFAAAAGLQLALWLTLYAVYFPRPRMEIDWKACAGLVREALPFAGICLVGALFTRLDYLALNILAGDRETGLLSGAMAIITVLIYLCSALQNSIFPVFSTFPKMSGAEALGVYRRVQTAALALSAPMAFGLSVLAPQILALLFKEKFASSSPLLVFLSWGLVLYFLASTFNTALRAMDKEAVSLRLMVWACAANLALDLALIPFFGAKGAVAGNLLTKILWTVLSYRALKALFPRLAFARDAARILCAAAIMAFPVYWFRDSSLLLVVPGGALVYIVSLLALRALTWQEARALLAGSLSRTPR